MKQTLQNLATKCGVTRQAVWLWTPKGRVYSAYKNRLEKLSFTIYKKHWKHIKKNQVFEGCEWCAKGGEKI